MMYAIIFTSMLNFQLGPMISRAFRLNHNKHRFCQVIQKMSAHAHQTNLDAKKVYLRRSKDSDELGISFKYLNDNLKIDREFNFCRKLSETIDGALNRIRNNVEKEVNKKQSKMKKKKSNKNKLLEDDSSSGKEAPAVAADIEVTVDLLRANEKLNEMTFSELLEKEPLSDIHLRIMEQTYEVVMNAPWVSNLVLPTSLLAGCMIYPSKIEMQFAERQYSRGLWFKAKKPASGDLQRGAQWQECGEGFFYNCTNEDVGHYVKFVLTPGNSKGVLGPSVESISKTEVQAGPGLCPFETRHCFTRQNLQDNSYRIVSYNLLADLYADSDYSRTHLFPYCPPYALKMDYRKQLFLREIIGYKADIIFLQEVDMKIFNYDLQPVLQDAAMGGFRGEIAQKGTCGEGVAIFHRHERLECVKSCAVNIGENISTLANFAKVWTKIKGNEKLVERICDRSTTLQLVLLRCKESSNYILVANTHLYFHPDADHIRLLQMGFAISYVQHMHNLWSEELGLNATSKERMALVFCGDFNSVPECGIYKLMTERFVGSDFVDWSSNPEQAVEGVTLSQPYNMASACGTPPYTNYTEGFAACLDYIFYQSDHFAVEQVVPLPTEDELKAHIAIPSVVFPSDHVALVADLKWKGA